jgi:hypothetical protein
MTKRQIFPFAILGLLLMCGTARAYLPGDRFAWWNATPPPTGAYTQQDSIETFFNKPILRLEDFDANNGWSDHPLVTVHRFDGTPAQLVRHRVDEAGASGDRLVLEVASGPDGNEGPPGGRPADEQPVVLDFSTPQRAVAVQFGLICNEEVNCRSAQEQPGVDAVGIELWAFDERHNAIVSASLPIGSDQTVAPDRTDYVIGLRDEKASIYRVELRLGVGNSKTGSRIRANPLLRRIYYEPFPHAAVLQVEVPVAQPMVLALPYHFDQAAAIVRGFHLRENTLFAITGFEFKVDTSVANGQVTLTASGTTKTEISKTSTPLEKVYASLIAWDSSQVELFVEDHSLFGRDRSTMWRDRWVVDPCRFNACGPPRGNHGWPSIVMSGGFSFDQVDSSVDNTGWHVFFVDQDPTWNRDLARGEIQLFMQAQARRDGDDPIFEMDLTRRILAGRSVVANAGFGSGLIPLPDTGIDTHAAERAWLYSPETMEDLGYFCDMDAPVAAVGARAFVVNMQGVGNQIELRRAIIPEEIDIEIQGVFSGDRVRARVGGKLKVSDSILDPVPGQIFVVPACVGIRPVRREAVPIVHGARFASLVGRPRGPEEAGRIYNAGPGPFTITGAALEGDAAPFDLSLKLNGQYFAPLSVLGGNVTVLLRPGEFLDVDGTFEPHVPRQSNAIVQFKTNLPGEQLLEMPVLGRIPSTAEWLPIQLNFGSIEVKTTASRNALLVVSDVVPVQVFRFRIDGDPENNFSVIPEPGRGASGSAGFTLRPGESTYAEVLFDPEVLGPQDAPDAKMARVVAETDVGDIGLEVMGEALPPPRPNAELNRRDVQFGLVRVGESDESMITLSNTGLGLLHLNQVVLSGDPAFETDPLPADFRTPLGSQETSDFLIRFNASPPHGLKRGELTIQTDGGDLHLPISGYAAP